jgi:hypothetical protein
MNPSLKSLALVASALVLAQPMTAAAAEDDCTVKSRSNAVVLMHCKAQLDDKVWADAAKAACEPGKACNVWIWEDRGMIPLTAPETDTDLPKSATRAAVAVWINDSANLMKLKKVR